MNRESTTPITKEGVIGYLLIIGFGVLVVMVLAFVAGLFLAASIPPNLD